MRHHVGRSIGNRLRVAGLVPEDCRNLTLSIPAGGAVELHYDILVTDEHLRKLRDVLDGLLQDQASEATERR